MRRIVQLLPNPALTVTVVTWGFNFVAIKLAYREVDPPAVSIVRYLAMLPLLAALTILAGDSLRYPKGQVLRYLWAGFLFGGVYMVLFLEGMRRATPAEGAIALATIPIWTTLIAALRGQEILTRRLVAGVGLGFVGVAVVIAGGPQGLSIGSLGTVWVLGSALVWAYSITLMQPLLAERSPYSVTTLALPGSALALIPYGALATVRQDWGAISVEGWLALGYMAVMAGVIGFATFYIGVRQVGPARSSLVQYFIPFIAAASGWWVLGTPMTWTQGAGLVVVLAAMALVRRPVSSE